ncbi:MAG: hypothetical protein U0559_09055 [Anaerolineae bacterium]
MLLGANPFQAYGALIEGVLGSVSGLTQSLVKATPLLLVGLGICIASGQDQHRCGRPGSSLGAGDGDVVLAAVPRVGGLILIPATLLMGFCGRVWGFIPGVLKARLGVNEILSTVMLNAIALQFMNLRDSRAVD